MIRRVSWTARFVCGGRDLLVGLPPRSSRHPLVYHTGPALGQGKTRFWRPAVPGRDVGRVAKWQTRPAGARTLDADAESAILVCTRRPSIVIPAKGTIRANPPP